MYPTKEELEGKWWHRLIKVIIWTISILITISSFWLFWNSRPDIFWSYNFTLNIEPEFKKENGGHPITERKNITLRQIVHRIVYNEHLYNQREWFKGSKINIPGYGMVLLRDSDDLNKYIPKNETKEKLLETLSTFDLIKITYLDDPKQYLRDLVNKKFDLTEDQRIQGIEYLFPNLKLIEKREYEFKNFESIPLLFLGPLCFLILNIFYSKIILYIVYGKRLKR